jgi:hypothetical protein
VIHAVRRDLVRSDHNDQSVNRLFHIFTLAATCSVFTADNNSSHIIAIIIDGKRLTEHSSSTVIDSQMATNSTINHN